MIQYLEGFPAEEALQISKITAPGTQGNWSQLGTSWLLLPLKLKVTGVPCEKPYNRRLHCPPTQSPHLL